MDGGFRSKYRLTQQLLVILFATKLILARRNIFNNGDGDNDNDNVNDEYVNGD